MGRPRLMAKEQSIGQIQQKSNQDIIMNNVATVDQLHNQSHNSNQQREQVSLDRKQMQAKQIEEQKQMYKPAPVVRPQIQQKTQQSQILQSQENKLQDRSQNEVNSLVLTVQQNTISNNQNQQQQAQQNSNGILKSDISLDSQILLPDVIIIPFSPNYSKIQAGKYENLQTVQQNKLKQKVDVQVQYSNQPSFSNSSLNNNMNKQVQLQSLNSTSNFQKSDLQETVRESQEQSKKKEIIPEEQKSVKPLDKPDHKTPVKIMDKSPNNALVKNSNSKLQEKQSNNRNQQRIQQIMKTENNTVQKKSDKINNSTTRDIDSKLSRDSPSVMILMDDVQSKSFNSLYVSPYNYPLNQANGSRGVMNLSTMSGSTQSNREMIRDGSASNTILRVKQQRQIVERDEKLLNNRINMLQNEETKVLKKIEKTRIRAEQLQEIQRNNDERHKSLMMADIERQKRIEERQLRILQERKEKQSLLDLQMKQRQEELLSNASELRKEKVFIVDIKNRFKIEQQQVNSMRKLEVQSQELQANFKLQKRREEFIRSMQQIHKQKYDQEYSTIQRKEHSIHKLENMESQLLERLQKTQKKEADVYRNLETVIKDSISSHKERLDFKIKKNEEIRQNYKKPPTIDHLQNFLEQNSNIQSGIGLSRASMGNYNSVSVTRNKMPLKSIGQIESKHEIKTKKNLENQIVLDIQDMVIDNPNEAYQMINQQQDAIRKAKQV
eukprot:403365560